MPKGKIFLISIFVLLILASFFIFFRMKKNSEKSRLQTKNDKKYEVTAEKEKPLPENALPENQDVFEGNREEYKKIIGSWSTECLIANPKNPLSEKHEFIFKENGTAQHWRLSGTDCENISRDSTTHNYKIAIPEIGKINFEALDKNSDTIFDIYGIKGGILFFGHGPRDWYPLSLRNFGGSIETRFDDLNTFLKYQKK
jgi:hypothetical protein